MNSLGKSLLLPYTLMSLVLDFTQMVLDVRINRKPTQFCMLNNFCFNNFSKKSIPGEVLALGLLLAVRKHLQIANMIIHTTPFIATFPKNQSLGMPGLRSSRNLLAPPTLIRAGNPEVRPSWRDPGVKGFPTSPHIWA